MNRNVTFRWLRPLAIGTIACAATVARAQDPGDMAGDEAPPAGERADPRWTMPAPPPRAPPRAWPAKPGEASICLWRDDKMLAFSITIDDNSAPDIPWWIEMGNQYGFRFTWFIITRRVGTAFGGTWEQFRKLVEMGHDVQSHTATHNAGSMTIEDEYRLAIEDIEKNIPGHRVRVLAYPGGAAVRRRRGQPYVNNDVEVAAKYYIGARGAGGQTTPAIGMPYLRTGRGAGIFDHERWTLNSFLNPGHLNYRGWHIVIYHTVSAARQRTGIEEGLRRVKEHEADIWVGLFREVVMYARQRDAATLKVDRADAREIVFTLTDTLDDAIFDLPLTVKVRLFDAWQGVSAQQAGKPVTARIVEHEGARFALVEAVPDRGRVTIRPAAH